MNTFFPSTITEWNKLDLSIRNSTNLNIFKRKLLQFVKAIGIKSLTRLRLELSRLSYHKFKYGFLDAADPHRKYSSLLHFFKCAKYLSQ